MTLQLEKFQKTLYLSMADYAWANLRASQGWAILYCIPLFSKKYQFAIRTYPGEIFYKFLIRKSKKMLTT